MARKKLLTEGEIRQFMKLANLRPMGRNRLSEMGYGSAPMPSMPGQRDDEMGDEEVAMGPEGAEEEAEMDMDMDMDMDAAPAEGGDMVSMDDFMSALERAIEEVTGEEADVSEEPGDAEGAEDMDMEMEMGAEEDPMDDEEEPMMEQSEAEKRRAASDRRKKIDAEEKKAKDKGKKGFNEGEELDEVHYGFGSGEKRQPKMKAPRRTGPAMGFGEPDEEEEEESEMLPATDPKDDPPLRRKKRSKVARRSPGGVGMPALGMEEQVVNEVAKRVKARLHAESQREQMVDALAERIMKRLTK